MLITSPTKRRDQGLPLVTCHGFAPPTFLHQGLALRASVPAITEAIRPEAAGRLSWSCGWHDRRERQGEPERSSQDDMRSQPPFRFSSSPVPSLPRESRIVPSAPNPIPASLRSRGHVGRRTGAAGRAAWLRKTAAGHTGVGGRDGPPVAIRVLRRRRFLPESK